MHNDLINVPLFDGLSEHGFKMLLERSETSSVKAGDVIVSEGDISNRFFLLRQGSVRICKKQGQPDEVRLATIEAGDFFGEMCILESVPRSATVVAESDAKLISLSTMDFHHLRQCYPDQHGILATNLARSLARRLRKLDEIFAARQ